MNVVEGSSTLLSARRGESDFDGLDLGAPPPPPAGGQSGLLMRLRRRKLVFTTVFVLTLALVAGAYTAMAPVYRAEASVTVVPPDTVLGSQQSSSAQQLVGDSSDLESQSIIVSSPLQIRELLKQQPIRDALMAECEAATPPAWKLAVKAWLGLKPPVPCAEQLQDTAGLVANIRARLAVATNGRSRVINVAYSSTLAEVAQVMANGIVQSYLDSRTREKLLPRDEAIDWLRSETSRVSDRLKANEQQIEAFLHARGVVKGQLAPIASEQLTNLSQQLALAEADRAAAAGRMQQARGGGTSGVLENRGVGDLKQQLALVTAQIAQMSARYGSANPALMALQGQRQALEGMVSQETGLVNRSAASDYQAASSRVASLRAQIDGLKQDVRGNDDATTQVASLQRDATTDRELLLDLTKNLNQLETSRRLVTANAQLVSMAEVPQDVFFPKISTFALAGLMLATAFATVAAILRDRADLSVREIGELSSAASLRVLARVPHVSRLGRHGTHLQRRMQKPSAFQEAIRQLYAECLLLSAGRRSSGGPARTIMVSSAASGEGKTFITLALAHFGASAGLRVLVLECDLRRPSIGRSLGEKAAHGVVDILRGTATPDEVLSPSASGGLDVIVAGTPVMDSTELLGGARMQDLLDWARARYDLVLIDTPPSRALPDARVLAPDVDAILYCAQWGRSQMPAVLTGIAEIRRAGGRVWGLVLDRVEPDQFALYDSANPRAPSYLIAGAG